MGRYATFQSPHSSKPPSPTNHEYLRPNHFLASTQPQIATKFHQLQIHPSVHIHIHILKFSPCRSLCPSARYTCSWGVMAIWVGQGVWLCGRSDVGEGRGDVASSEREKTDPPCKKGKGKGGRVNYLFEKTKIQVVSTPIQATDTIHPSPTLKSSSPVWKSPFPLPPPQISSQPAMYTGSSKHPTLSASSPPSSCGTLNLLWLLTQFP